MSEKSPGIDYQEREGLTPLAARISAPTVFIVSSRKGPVGVPTLVRDVSELKTTFGDYEDTEYFKQFAPIAFCLENSGPAIVTRIARPSFTYASTEFPSNDQIVGFRVDGENFVIENESTSFAVYAQTALGNEIDVTKDANYALKTPSLGLVTAGNFTAGSTLGTAIIEIQVQGNVLIFAIEIQILKVVDIQIIGPSIVVSGQPSQFRAIAYFINETAQDVTFEAGCQWSVVAGNVSSVNVGEITANTVSVDDLATVRVTFKEFSVDFNIQVTPTYFKLVSAGESVFGIGNFNADLRPEYEGIIESHTVEWEISTGSNGSIDSVNSLETTFRMNANASDYFLLTLFIDRNTINEQSANVSISKGALSEMNLVASVPNDWSFILDSQGKWNVPGSLSSVPDIRLGPTQATRFDGLSVQTAILYSGASYSFLWSLTYDLKDIQIAFVIPQKYENGWKNQGDLSENDYLPNISDGFYRLKILYYKGSKSERVTMLTASVLHKQSALSKIGSEFYSGSFGETSEAVTGYLKYPKQLLELPFLESSFEAATLAVSQGTAVPLYEVYPKVLVEVALVQSTMTQEALADAKSFITAFQYYAQQIV